MTIYKEKKNTPNMRVKRWKKNIYIYIFFLLLIYTPFYLSLGFPLETAGFSFSSKLAGLVDWMVTSWISWLVDWMVNSWIGWFITSWIGWLAVGLLD